MENAEGADRRRALAAVVGELDGDKQMVLAMHYSQGLSYAEIAMRLGITEDTVRGRLFLAREALRVRLKAVRP
jgi:RNA polymerase sigma-70 factor (ECF subfamily)